MHSCGHGAQLDLMQACGWLLQASQNGYEAARAQLRRLQARLNPAQLDTLHRFTANDSSQHTPAAIAA